MRGEKKGASAAAAAAAVAAAAAESPSSSSSSIDAEQVQQQLSTYVSSLLQGFRVSGFRSAFWGLGFSYTDLAAFSKERTQLELKLRVAPLQCLLRQHTSAYVSIPRSWS